MLPISPDSSLQPLMTVLDLALLVFILYVAVNIRHRLSMGLALGQLAGMIYLDFFMLEGHQATAFPCGSAGPRHGARDLPRRRDRVHFRPRLHAGA